MIHGNALIKVHVSKVTDTNYVMKYDENTDENSVSDESTGEDVDIKEIENDEERNSCYKR